MMLNIKKVAYIIVLMIAVIISIVIGSVIVSKLTCDHNNEYEIEILEYKKADCRSEGLSIGKKCGYCGKILVPQEPIPTIACRESEWIIDKAQTLTENGKQHKECTMCGKIIQEEVLYAGSIGLVFKQNEDGTYTVAGDGDCRDNHIVIPQMHCGMPVTQIDTHAFSANYSLHSIVIPESVTEIGDYAFSNCIFLESIVIPKNVQSVGDYVFHGCNKLTSVEFKNSKTCIGHSAFWGCSKLTKVVLPKMLEEIGFNTFYKCTSLTEIIIPASVRLIGNAAFLSCTALESIQYGGTTNEWNAIVFANDWRARVPATEVKCSNGRIVF